MGDKKSLQRFSYARSLQEDIARLTSKTSLRIIIQDENLLPKLRQTVRQFETARLVGIGRLNVAPSLKQALEKLGLLKFPGRCPYVT